ncbi:MAG: hypothetical protein WA459_03250 [Stellaceae bacterium]
MLVLQAYASGENFQVWTTDAQFLLSQRNSMRFSQKHGFRPVRSVIQVDVADDALRNALWSTVHTFVLGSMHRYIYVVPAALSPFADALWVDHYKQPIDTRPAIGYDFYKAIKEAEFGGQWYEIYDLISFILERFAFRDTADRDRFRDLCNANLQREMSAWRVVGDEIARLTSEEEIAAVEESLTSSGPVATHIATALARLSDRAAPDFRNSIKESISEVEAMCRSITGDRKATLGNALNLLEENGINLHPALKSAFEKLYGYSSDSDGIRHSLLEESRLDFEDAKFMLVSCAAFINLLRARSGIID